MRPVCVPCGRFFRVIKNDFLFILDDLNHDEKWEPYQIWSSDRYECPQCGAAILAGFAKEPWADIQEPDFDETVKRIGAALHVRDF